MAVNLKISRGILDNGRNSKNPREREYKPDIRDAGIDKGEWKDRSCPGGNAERRGCANQRATPCHSIRIHVFN